jgi:hypothetical protein
MDDYCAALTILCTESKLVDPLVTIIYRLEDVLEERKKVR